MENRRTHASALAKTIGAVSLALSVTACGDFVATAGVGQWKKVPSEPLRTGPLPEVRVVEAGGGPPVGSGSLVEVDIEVLEPTPLDKHVRRGSRTAWLWLGGDPEEWRKMDLGNWGARFVLVGRNIGATLAVDAKSQVADKGPPHFGSDYVYPEPFGEGMQAVDVFDTVYRLKVRQSCPAQMLVASGTYREFGFVLGCRGDFIPACSPSIMRSAPFYVYKVVAKCNGTGKAFVSRVFSQPPPPGLDSTGFARKTDQLRKDLASARHW